MRLFHALVLVSLLAASSLGQAGDELTDGVIWLGGGDGNKVSYTASALFELRNEIGQMGLGIERMQLDSSEKGDDFMTLYGGFRLPSRPVSPYINFGLGWYGSEFAEFIFEVFGDCTEKTTNEEGETQLERLCDSDIFTQQIEAGVELEFNTSWAMQLYGRRYRFDNLDDRYMTTAGLRLGVLF